MIEELYAELCEKGVFLKTSDDFKIIEFDAPPRVFTEELRARVKACKPEMIDYLAEIEETAAILEIEQGCMPKLARVLSRKMVEHRRMCEREDVLMSGARSHPFFQEAEAACFNVLGCGLEIVSVERSTCEVLAA